MSKAEHVCKKAAPQAPTTELGPFSSFLSLAAAPQHHVYQQPASVGGKTGPLPALGSPATMTGLRLGLQFFLMLTENSSDLKANDH